MNCRGCGSELDREATQAAIDRAVDEVLEASVVDARERGGVCPLCGHSHYVPFYNRESFRTGVLVGILLLVGLILIVTWYTRSPIRSSLAQEMIGRARQDVRVQQALGTPITPGLLASGGITADETGWSEAKINIPLKGPKASGTLRIVAGRGDGRWVVSKLELWVEEQARPINLLLGKVEVTNEPGYVSVHTQPAQIPEMLNAVAAPPTSDGSYPVIRFTMNYDPGRATPLTGSLTSRSPHFLDGPESTFEVDLRSGTFALRRTDLFVQDSIPLVFTRAFHTWGLERNRMFLPGTSHPAFGSGSSHSYDICPLGTRNPYTWMNLYMADGNFIHLDRITQGTGYGDAWYEQTETSAEFYKARLWWNGNGWTLRFQDGTVYEFPESYNGKNLAQGAPFEMRDNQGRSVHIIRDAERNLRRLVSPGARTISLEYDNSGRVSQANDDEGHTIDYSYDWARRLVSVSMNRQPIFRYVYDDSHLDQMVAIEDGSGRVLLRNSYDHNGRVAAQVSADGGEYSYRYFLDGPGVVGQTIVTRPDHTKVTFTFRDGLLVSQSPFLQ